MTVSAIDFLKMLKFLRRRAYFWDGLLVLILLLLVASWSVCRFLLPHLGGLARYCGFASPSGLKDGICLLLYAISLLSGLVFWRRIRSLPEFGKGELGVVFAPDYPEDLQDDAERLFVSLEQHVKRAQLGNTFSVRWLPPNMKLSSSEGATDLLQSCHGVTAVWGTFDKEQGEGGRSTGFGTLSFTFIHSGGHLHPLRARNLGLPIEGRRLHIRESNQIADRDILARDIGLVVRNLMGTTLLSRKKYDEAVKVLGPLSVDLRALAKHGPRPVKGAYAQAKYDLALALTMCGHDQFVEYLFNGKLFSIPEGQIRAWLANAEQARALDPQNSLHPLRIAIYHFLLGDIEKAIRASLRAKEVAPVAMAAPNLSLAFLYNFCGNYSKSRNEYRRALSKKTSYDEFMICHCITFIEQTLSQFPEKKQLRLALGLLQLRRGDPVVGRREIEGFVEEAKESQGFDDFLREGNRLLQEKRDDNESEGG